MEQYNDQFFELLKSTLQANNHSFLTLHVPHTTPNYKKYRTREEAELLAKGFNEIINGDLSEEMPEDSVINAGGFDVGKGHSLNIRISYKE